MNTVPLLPAETETVAVFSDVHGNIRALKAVLDDITKQGVDAVVCNGDLITGSSHGPDVVECIRRLGIPCTRGNHERYLHELGDPAHEKWRQANWAPLHFDYHDLSANHRTWLTNLPGTLWLYGGDAPLVMAHAAPSDDVGRISAKNSEDDWRAIFSDMPERTTLVGSHLHWFWQHEWQKNRFVRTPATGLPLDGDRRAGYVILRREAAGWRAQQYRVGYDAEAELAAFRQSEAYRAGGVIAHLFWEELRTARWRVVPFFQHLNAISDDESAHRSTNGLDAETLQRAWQSFDHTQFPIYNPDAPGFHF
jgi:hypothetical protein